MPTNLSVNLNAVALLRNRRDLAWPSVTGIGALALDAGAHGLTVHPRPDERHIRRSDVHELKAMLSADWPGREFNIEGYPDAGFLKLIETVKPDQVTLVPDEPGQATSDHGWNIEAEAPFLKDVIAEIQSHGCRVSLFVDAEPSRGGEAKTVGADRVEIFTGPYGSQTDVRGRKAALGAVTATVTSALEAGLAVNAGHDLTLENLPALMAAAPGIAECSIGHCFTADCLIYGVAETVKRYLIALGHQR